MLSDLLFSINAVFPIILVAAFGFIARKLNIIDDAFVKSGNKFCFRFGFFAMMFVNIYKIESLDKIRWNVVLFAVISAKVIENAVVCAVLQIPCHQPLAHPVRGNHAHRYQIAQAPYKLPVSHHEGKAQPRHEGERKGIDVDHVI